MGIFNKKNTGKVVDAAISGIDKLFFTKEEKMDYGRKVAELQLKHTEMTLGENTARSLTRRYLAVLIMSVFLLLILASGVAYCFDKDYAAYLFKLAESISPLSMMVAAFFFGAYMVGSHMINKYKKDKKDK